MILEGIVTTVSPTGKVNISPMGPTVTPRMQQFMLRPFPSSTTYQNLKAHGQGVLHVTDNVLLLAKAAVGDVEPIPEMFPATTVKGFVLAESCRYYEFEVRSMDESEQRVRIQAEVVYSGVLREFFGFNRAKHAVVEAAILATRTSFLPMAQIQSEFERLRIIVDKTAGTQELEAFDFLQRYIENIRKAMAAAEIVEEDKT